MHVSVVVYPGGPFYLSFNAMLVALYAMQVCISQYFRVVMELHVRVCGFMHIYMYIHVHDIYMYVHVHLYIYRHLCAHIHIHIHTYIIYIYNHTITLGPHLQYYSPVQCILG